MLHSARRSLMMDWTPFSLQLAALWLPTTDKVTLDGTNGLIQLDDQSSTGVHMTRTDDATKRPIWSATSFNGHAGLTFDATNDSLVSATSGPAITGGGITIIAAVQVTSGAFAQVLNVGTELGLGVFELRRYASNNYTEIVVHSGGSDIAHRRGSSAANVAHIVTATYDGTTPLIYYAGVSEDSGGSLTGSRAMPGASPWHIGARAGTELFAGMVFGGALVTHGVLSAADRQNAERWLAARTGLTVA